MKVLLDTNVILDVILSREPYLRESEEILTLACREEIEAAATASSITDIYYIVSKRLGDAAARDALRNLFNILVIICVDGDDCVRALDLPMADYEDALVTVCADKSEIDCIISNDEKLLQANHTSVRVVSTSNFLEAL